MIAIIKTKLLDVLAQGTAATKLCDKGESYPAGWKGVKRTSQDGVAAGYVNLFATRQAAGSTENRPAIYLGTAGFQFTDKQDFEVCDASRVQYRVVMIPLVICALGQGANADLDADAQCGQLLENAHQILFAPENIAVEGAWWNLTVADDTEARGLGATGTGGAEMQGAVSVAVLPIEVHYSFRAATPA